MDKNQQELSDSEEQLVADFLGDYTESVRDGKAVSVEDYCEGLPNEACRAAFRKTAPLASMAVVGGELGARAEKGLKQGEACPLSCGGTLIMEWFGPDDGIAICDGGSKELPPHHWEVGDGGRIKGKSILSSTRWSDVPE